MALYYGLTDAGLVRSSTMSRLRGHSNMGSCKVQGRPSRGATTIMAKVRRRCLTGTAVVSILVGLSSLVHGMDNERPALSVVDRVVTQDQGAWVIDYQLRHTGTSGIVIMPAEIQARVEGWVSNSRIGSHTLPRWSSIAIQGSPELSGVYEVIPAADEANRCRERLQVFIATEDTHPPELYPSPRAGTGSRVERSRVMATNELAPSVPVSLGPGSILRLRLRLEHQHILYGEYDPLLAVARCHREFRSSPRSGYCSARSGTTTGAAEVSMAGAPCRTA